MSIERRRINAMLDALKALFPGQMVEIENAKRKFERVCTDYDLAVKEGDVTRAQALVAEMQKAQAALEHPACSLGLAVSSYLPTETSDMTETF